MSRKSLSGKKKINLWMQCQNCNSYFTHKDCESHTKECTVTETNAEDSNTSVNSLLRNESYIRDRIFYTKNLDIQKPLPEFKDIPDKQLNKLIFISDATIKLCNFLIGEEVAVSCCFDDGQGLILVRLVYPTKDTFLSTVFVSEQDYNFYWSSKKNKQIKIQKLSSNPEPIAEITLKYLDQFETLQTLSKDDLRNFLHAHLCGLIFHEKTQIVCSFLNKTLKFDIVKFKSNLDDNCEDLDKKFSQLTVTDHMISGKFLKFHNLTQIFFAETNIENSPNKSKLKHTVTKDDIGGLDEVLQNVEEAINVALGFQKTLPGMEVSKGLLLYGPTGCGKTMICEAIANDIKAEICKINTSEIFSKFYGETEKNLQKYFDKAFKNYPKPTLIIIEDINNLCPKQEMNEIAKRVSIAFLNMLDSLHFKREAKYVFVLATTSDIDGLNSSIRRCGRFDCEIEIGVPNPENRLQIIQKHLNKIDHNLTNEQIKEIANITHGFVGSDLANLVSKAALTAIKESHLKVEISDMFTALNQIKPSAMREISIENPNVKWEDIGGQENLKLKLKQAIEWPLLYPEKFEKFGIKPPRGILMFGPPGCSKTMIAKALATESRLNFLSIKGPELFSMWVGESERAVREVFRKARQVAPAIIFFDEIDAIGGERSSESGSSVKERVLAQMLTELDGVTALKNVTIVAATNRPDMIDKALMRPGRIDRIIYVGLPDDNTRKEIFKIKLKKMPLANDVNVDNLIKLTQGYSGAEIQAVCQEAALKALEDSLDSENVSWIHFEHALNLVKPRTSPELLKLYNDYIKKS